MAPEGYVRDRQRFEDLRQQLSEVMIFHELVINEKGRVARASAKATTLSEGAKLVGRLHTELRHRAVHDLLFTYCSEELVNQSLFHAISEAAKSIPNRVREMTGLIGDGWVLYNAAFGHRDGKNRIAPGCSSTTTSLNLTKSSTKDSEAFWSEFTATTATPAPTLTESTEKRI